MAKKPLLDEITEEMLEHLVKNNEDPEAYWNAKAEAQSRIDESIVPAVTGPQDLSFLSKKPEKSQR